MVEAFKQVKRGLGKLLFIIGEAGIGKTELVYQFQRQLERGTANFLMGKFYEFGNDSPYRPYLDILYSFVRATQNYSPEGWVQTDVIGLAAQIRSGLDELDNLINVSQLEAGPVEERIKYQAFELLTNIFVTISISSPVILFLDDIQWADPLSLEFLAYFVRNTDENRILVICTGRNQEVREDSRPIKAWLRRISHYNNYEQIRLGSLSDMEIRALIDSIFGNIKISEGVIHQFYNVTQGNPFYLGEIIRQLIQEEKIHWTGDRWQCADLDEIELPSTILELVELRLNRFDKETLDLFTCAAVAGEKFTFQLLQAISGLPKERLMDKIDIGLHEFIIKEADPANKKRVSLTHSSDDFFVFYHSTIRQVLYEQLSSEDRLRLHAQIGEKLESLHPRKFERKASELAYHFFYGANYPKAFSYSATAGELARNAFAIEEALKYYSFAEESLKQLTGAGEQIEYGPEWMVNYHLAYGYVLMHLGKNERARDQLGLSLKISQEAGLAPVQGRIFLAMGELSWSCGHYEEGLGYCKGGLQILRQADDLGRECRLFYVIGNIYFSQGNFDEAIVFYNRSLELSQQIGDRASEGEALRGIGSIMGLRNQTRSALDRLEQALVIARAIGNRQNEWGVMMLIGNIYLEQGDPNRAAEHYRHSLAIARNIGRRRGEGRISINMGELFRQTGDLSSAETYLKEAQTIGADIQDREIEGHALSNLGLIYEAQGELDRALDCFQQAFNIFHETRYRSNVEVEALSGIGRILGQQGEVSEARNFLQLATTSGRQLGLWHLVVPDLRRLAACERTLGDLAAAHERLGDALYVVRTLLTDKLSEQEHQSYRQLESELTAEITSLKMERD